MKNGSNTVGVSWEVTWKVQISVIVYFRWQLVCSSSYILLYFTRSKKMQRKLKMRIVFKMPCVFSYPGVDGWCLCRSLWIKVKWKIRWARREEGKKRKREELKEGTPCHQVIHHMMATRMAWIFAFSSGTRQEFQTFSLRRGEESVDTGSKEPWPVSDKCSHQSSNHPTIQPLARCPGESRESSITQVIGHTSILTLPYLNASIPSHICFWTKCLFLSFFFSLNYQYHVYQQAE